MLRTCQWCKVWRKASFTRTEDVRRAHRGSGGPYRDGDGNIENPRAQPAAIPETGGDIAFKKKPQQPDKNSNVTRGVKARYFGARTGCQSGTTPALLTKKSRR